MDQIAFDRALRRHCRDRRADCTQCDLRLYCYTPPIERTDALMSLVVRFIQGEVDHYSVLEQIPGCPMGLNFEGAIGYKEQNESASSDDAEKTDSGIGE